jgi:hypothetical protein
VNRLEHTGLAALLPLKLTLPRPAARHLRAVRPVVAAVAVCGAALVCSLTAQTPARARLPHPPLQFSGFEVGQSLEGVARRAGALGGRLSCDRSRSDPTLHDCRAQLTDSAGRRLELWLSAVDSGVSVMTIAARVDAVQLAGWQRELLTRHGSARDVQQGAQHAMQWIRSNTMLRLTWRPEGDDTMASVSLVDGARLDAWGRRTEHRMQRKMMPDSAAADTARPIRH